MKKIILLTIATLLAINPINTAYATQKATLVKCNDGDTCRFKVDGKIINVRFSSIDAPESDQPYGKEAKLYLLKLLKEGNITLNCHGNALGNRTACEVFSNNKDVQSLMVSAGMAFDYPLYSKSKYQQQQKIAQKSKIGMWKQQNLTSAYCWRWTGKQECQNPLYQP